MKEQDITDEQILEEAKEILANPYLRKCSACAFSDDQCTVCSKTGRVLFKNIYAGLCPHFETHEERIIRLSRQRLKNIEKEETKVNFLLTMALNSIDMSMIYLEDIESRLEREFKLAEMRGTGDPKVRASDREWMRKLKMASKEMTRHMEGMRKQYNHAFMPVFNKVFFNKETKEYDVKSWDDHNEDTYQFAETFLRLFDGSLNNPDAKEQFKDAIMALSQKRTFEENDYKRYNFKR